MRELKGDSDPLAESHGFGDAPFQHGELGQSAQALGSRWMAGAEAALANLQSPLEEPRRLLKPAIANAQPAELDQTPGDGWMVHPRGRLEKCQRALQVPLFFGRLIASASNPGQRQMSVGDLRMALAQPVGPDQPGALDIALGLGNSTLVEPDEAQVVEYPGGLSVGLAGGLLCRSATDRSP